jgi:hypothetical protein
MGELALIDRALLAAAVALLVLGAAAASLSDNGLKRLIGLVIAWLGAVAAAAALSASQQLIVAGAAILFAQLAFGVALVIRLQETYGSIEAGDIDAADADDEPPDSAA